jgi:hypothetical protein
MRVLTAGDKNFYHCMVGLAQSVCRYYGKPLIIYDIGLTDEQRNNLDAEIVNIKIDVDFASYTKHNNAEFINTTHKPFCIKHYFENNSEPLIYTDADCLFLEKVELSGFDLGVTLKPKRKRKYDNYFNGIINAGVIFFNTKPEQFLERWIEGCCRENVTDQSILAEVLSETIDFKKTDAIYDWHGLSVKTLRIEDYNDYYLKTGKIYHFKGDRHQGQIYQQLLDAIANGQDPYEVFRKKKKNIFSGLFGLG